MIRWRIKLEECDSEVKYKKDCKNGVADSLSRVKINIEEDDNSLLMSAQVSGIMLLTDKEIDKMLDTDQAITHIPDENPVFLLPITDKNIHIFNNRIIIMNNKSIVCNNDHTILLLYRSSQSRDLDLYRHLT